MAVVPRILTHWSWDAGKFGKVWSVTLSLCIDTWRCLNCCCSKCLSYLIFIPYSLADCHCSVVSVLYGPIPLIYTFISKIAHQPIVCVSLLLVLYGLLFQRLSDRVFSPTGCVCDVASSFHQCSVACVLYVVCHKTVHCHVVVNSEWRQSSTRFNRHTRWVSGLHASVAVLPGEALSTQWICPRAGLRARERCTGWA